MIPAPSVGAAGATVNPFLRRRFERRLSPGFTGRFVLGVWQPTFIPSPPEYSPVGRAPKYPEFRPRVVDLTNDVKNRNDDLMAGTPRT